MEYLASKTAIKNALHSLQMYKFIVMLRDPRVAHAYHMSKSGRAMKMKKTLRLRGIYKQNEKLGNTSPLPASLNSF